MIKVFPCMAVADICFILYKPAVPGNIGASARAMKTMGFGELRLIDPADHLSDEAKMMAHGSHDILENCKVYDSYDEAVADISFVICTTAKRRSAKVDYIPAPHLAQFITGKSGVTGKIAIVFGSEESGLPNNILLKANVGVTIPMATDYPSLNLSQAVMTIAYELNKQAGESNLPDEVSQDQKNQERATWQQLQERTSAILEEAGIQPSTPLYHRIIERMSMMRASDARLAHSVTARIMDLIKKR